jgi:hypothetical protein
MTHTGESKTKIFSQKLAGVGKTRESGISAIGYTEESGITGVGYTGKSRLPGVAYSGESLVQLSRPSNALKETIPQKSDCKC